MSTFTFSHFADAFIQSDLQCVTYREVVADNQSDYRYCTTVLYCKLLHIAVTILDTDTIMLCQPATALAINKSDIKT